MVSAARTSIETVTTPPDFRPAHNKLEAVTRISSVTGAPPETLGPGGKERRSVLANLADGLGLDLDANLSKVELGEALGTRLGFTWDSACWSAGNTITLTGLNRILEAAEQFLSVPGTSSLNEHSHGGTEVLSGDSSTQIDLDEARQEIQVAIAESLANLSQHEIAPPDVPMDWEPFKAEPPVDLQSDVWMMRIASLQGWLRFRSPLVMKSPDSFWDSLLSELGVGADGISAGLLTLEALDHLRIRAEHAVMHADAFVAEVQAADGETAGPSRSWGDAWDEVDELDEQQTAEPLVATTNVWPIYLFSKKAEKGGLNLTPSYQRSDVWPLADRQLLIQSILRGVPLPSVILLKPETPGLPHEVVDGKQRLTSILRFIGQHPVALDKVREADEQFPEDKFDKLFHEDYPKFRKTWKARFGEELTVTREGDYYFPFKLPVSTTGLPENLQPLLGKYYTQIRESVIPIAGGDLRVDELFEDAVEYKIPVIEYQQATQRQIHDVFRLYNKQGKHLNAEEIRNAIYHELGLTRGILVAAGDADDKDPFATIAPFLSDIRSEVDRLGENLKKYGIGTSRYRRTKLLSWMIALLAFDTRDSSGKVRMLSTAGHINALFDRVKRSKTDLLQRESAIRDVTGLVARAVDIHLGELAWHGAFPVGQEPGTPPKKKAWQDLQLVGTVVGVALAVAVHGDAVEGHIEDAGEFLEERSASLDWWRPSKTQTATQWKYIARLATDVATALGVDPATADKELERRFGGSGAGALFLLAEGLPAGRVS